VVSTQGGNPELLIPLPESGVGQFDGTWSPDGRRVVYSVDPRALRIFDLDRRESTKIPGSDGLYSARWSPDGRYIAALTSGDLMVKVFDMTTHQWSTLLENMGHWGFPTWSRDGKFLYGLNGVQGGQGVFRAPISGGKPLRVIDLTGFHPTGYFGFWMGLDPNDAPLLLRDNGMSDIYALTLERR
jgi:Tol biopolymer transport system component